MADETTAVLKEIAELLRKRVEQEDAVASRAIEASKRGAEMSARMQSRMDSMKMPPDAGGRPILPLTGNREEFRTAMESQREDDRQFKKGLLTELERHNTLLGEIIERLRRSPIV